jgi:hypothetical protein
MCLCRDAGRGEVGARARMGICLPEGPSTHGPSASALTPQASLEDVTGGAGAAAGNTAATAGPAPVLPGTTSAAQRERERDEAAGPLPERSSARSTGVARADTGGASLAK